MWEESSANLLEGGYSLEVKQYPIILTVCFGSYVPSAHVSQGILLGFTKFAAEKISNLKECI